MTYYVYIMASASRALYTGVTNNIERRAGQHKEGKIPGFSARYKTRELVYAEPFGDIRAAIAREKQIKGWLRKKKAALIRSVNPRWEDLSARWGAAHTGSGPNRPQSVILSGAKNLSEAVSAAPHGAESPPNGRPREILRPRRRDSE
jgi:putative endonuclease